MIQEIQVRVLPVVASSEQNIKRFVAEDRGIDVRTINAVRVLKRSIDARQRKIFINLTVRLYINEMPEDDAYVVTEYGDVSGKPAVIVVGEGPGGLFASLRLIELGLRPIVLERGKNVRDRKVDLANIKKNQAVDTESNYCFGEGGAGAYSDGKLYTRSKKRGSTEKILNVFCQHGASTAILADAHPHIGTDKLPKVIENMRETILRCGGEVHFQTKMTRMLIEGDKVTGVEAVNLVNGAEETYRGPVILATGHSARDVYRYLAEAKVEIEAKGIAVGVRLEHPSHLIDQIQYHSKEGRGKYLPAAEYSFVTQVEGRGVYSFCMCPGGYVIPSSSEVGKTVINGMSYAARDGVNANSALLVQVDENDYGFQLFDGLKYQEALEEKAYHLAGGYQACVQLAKDYIEGKPSHHFEQVQPSYALGYQFIDLNTLFSPEVNQALKEALLAYEKKIPGFVSDGAVLSAVESRSSSSIRILRQQDFQSNIQGIYPSGEGSGYAGGIMTSAIDGIRAAEKLIETFSLPQYNNRLEDQGGMTYGKKL